MIDAAQSGNILLVNVLMGNTILMEGKPAVAPALVVGSFEDPRGETGLLTKVMERLAEVSETDSAEARAVSELYSDTEYRPDRRRLLPKRLTDGAEVYAFDIVVYTMLLDYPLTECPMSLRAGRLMCMDQELRAAESSPGQLAVVRNVD